MPRIAHIVGIRARRQGFLAEGGVVFPPSDRAEAAIAAAAARDGRALVVEVGIFRRALLSPRIVIIGEGGSDVKAGGCIGFAERMKAKGKPHKQVLTAVARKLITLANAILKRGKPWTLNAA